MDNEKEGKSYHLQRFLNDTCTSLNKKSTKEKKSRQKRKQIKWPVLDNNRGIFENVLVGKTFCRASYSPHQKARMNEDIFSLARNRSDEVQILNVEKNDAGIQEPVEIEAFNNEGSVKLNTPIILEENVFKTPEREENVFKTPEREENVFKTPEKNKSPSIELFHENISKRVEPNKLDSPECLRKNLNQGRISDNLMLDFFDLNSEPSTSKRQKLNLSDPKPTNNFRIYRSNSTSSESDELNFFTPKMDVYKDMEHRNQRVKNESPKKMSKLSFFKHNFEHSQLKKRKRKNRLSPHTY